MLVRLDDNQIKDLIEEQVDAAVKLRIKELQGDYTSKGYIESLIKDIIFDKIIELCPNINRYIKENMEQCMAANFSRQRENLITKEQLVDEIAKNLLEIFTNEVGYCD